MALENIYIADLKNDTLLCSDELSASIFGLSLSEDKYSLSGVQLLNPHINFVVDTSGVLNLTELLNFAFPKDTTKEKKGNFELSINSIELVNARFRYGKICPQKKDFGVNFQDMRLHDLNIKGKNFCVIGDTIALDINSMSFIEQSGLHIENFRSLFSISNKMMKLNQLRVVSDSTTIAFSQLNLKYDGYDMLSSFTESVIIDAEFDNTQISTDFLSFFAPSLRGYSIPISINGTINGRVNDIRGRNLEISYNNHTYISSNLNITGLPEIDQTLFDIKFKELTSVNSDLKCLTKSDGKTPLIELPSILDTIGQITYRGKFVGYLNDFVAYGDIITDIGKLRIDASFLPKKKGEYRYKGKIEAYGVDVGRIASNNLFGKTTLKAIINGNIDAQKNIEAKTNINIQSIVANSYNYSDIKVEGTLTNKTYIGSVNLNDPNCKLNFLGKLDFSDSIPIFDFSAFVPKIDLVALNINKVDSISTASFLLTTKFSGSTLDNSKGEIKLVNSSYTNQRGSLKLSEVAILADNSSDSKVVALKSEFAEGELRSKYNYSNVVNYFSSLLMQYIPSIASKQGATKPPTKLNQHDPEYNDYLIKLRIKKTKKITDVLSPNIRLAENTSIFGILNPDLQTLTFKMIVPEIKIGNNSLKNLSIDGQTLDSSLVTSIISPNIQIGQTSIKDFKIDLEAMNNILNFSMNWDNKNTPINNGHFEARINLSDFRNEGHIANIDIKPTSLIINDSTWQIMPSSITIDTNYIAVKQFSINSNSQNLLIDGTISKQPTDTVFLNLNNLNTAAFNLYLNNLGYSVDGSITGNAKVSNLFYSPNLYADINIDNTELNKQPIGNIHFTSKWFNDNKRLAVKLNNIKNDSITIQAQGFIYSENSTIDLDVDLNSILLKHIEPILKGNVSDISGSIDGKFKVGGVISKPAINGSINFKNVSLVVDFLRTKYAINSPVTISNSDILFKNFKLVDVFNNEATLNGSITTQLFKEINMDLNLATKNFQCMNTTERDNESFYASAYGTGMVIISGSPSKMDMNIFIKTDNKTAIYLPLSNSSTVEENNFLSFASSNPDEIIIDDDFNLDFTPDNKSSELNLNMEIQVTPEAEAQIIIDKKMGDIIKANGRGNLKIEINPSKDVFKMLGSYQIEKGDYLFTLKSLLNKKLKIESGSSITWNGDPLDANTNITATYRVKTSLKPILGEQYTARIPVDCQILLTQKLMSPNIEFNITLPNGNSEEKAALATALNTQEKINTQFLGLLGINSFISDASVNSSTSENANLGTMGLYNTVSELLSNQLSNLLSSDKFDFGVNYRPGIEEELTSDQVELALSTQVFDDRLILNGSAFNNNNNDASAPIAGNFNAEFKLNKTGKLRAKAFARYNDDFLNTISTTENEYTTGVGFMYREEFNNFRDLLYKIRHLFSSDTQNQYDFGTEIISTDSTNSGSLNEENDIK